MSLPVASESSSLQNLKVTDPPTFGSSPSCQPAPEPTSPITHLPYVSEYLIRP